MLLEVFSEMADIPPSSLIAAFASLFTYFLLLVFFPNKTTLLALLLLTVLIKEFNDLSLTWKPFSSNNAFASSNAFCLNTSSVNCMPLFSLVSFLSCLTDALISLFFAGGLKKKGWVFYFFYLSSSLLDSDGTMLELSLQSKANSGITSSVETFLASLGD